MRVRRLLIILTTLGVSVVLLAPAIVQLVARHYINDARAQLEKQGIRLSVTGITGQLLGVSASSIDLWLPVRVGDRGAGFPIGLEFRDVSASLLPSLHPRVRVTGEAYGGKFDLTLSDLRNSTGPTCQAQIDSIDLGAHPQLNALGLSKAVASLTLEDARIPFDEHAAARASLKIDDASLSLSPRLIGLIGGEFQQVASLLKIEDITEASVRVEGTTEHGAFSLRPIDFSSSLGAVSGQARGTFNNGRGEPSLTASLRVDLTNGTSQLQNWLPLLSQNTLSSETTRFTTHVSSTSCANASAPTLRLGRICLRSRLSPESP